MGFNRTQQLLAFSATANKMLQPETEARHALSADRNKGRNLESASALPGGNGNAESSVIESRAPGDMPDVSPEFRGEMAALLAYYAARIAAAQLTLPASVAAGVIRTLRGEQTIALRALTDRWNAASQKRQAERPERPIPGGRYKDEGPKQSS